MSIQGIKEFKALESDMASTLLRAKKVLRQEGVAIHFSNTAITHFSGEEKAENQVTTQMVVQVGVVGDAFIFGTSSEFYTPLDLEGQIRAKTAKCMYNAINDFRQQTSKDRTLPMPVQIALATAQAEIATTFDAHPVVANLVGFTREEMHKSPKSEAPPPVMPKPIEEPAFKAPSDASVFYRIFLVDDFKYMEETFVSRNEAKRFLREQGLIRVGQIKRIRRSCLVGEYQGYKYKADYYGAKPGYFLDVWPIGSAHSISVTFLVRNECLDSVKDVYTRIATVIHKARGNK